MQQLERKDYRQRVLNTGDTLGRGKTKNLMKSFSSNRVQNGDCSSTTRRPGALDFKPLYRRGSAVLRNTCSQGCMKGRVCMFLFLWVTNVEFFQCLKHFLSYFFPWRLHEEYTARTVFCHERIVSLPQGKITPHSSLDPIFTVQGLMGWVNLRPNASINQQWVHHWNASSVHIWFSLSLILCKDECLYQLGETTQEK